MAKRGRDEENQPIDKTGSAWTQTELDAFGFQQINVSFEEMFSETEREGPLSSNLTDLKEAFPALYESSYDNAVIAKCPQHSRDLWTQFKQLLNVQNAESAVDDFVSAVFRQITSPPSTSVHSRPEWDFYVMGMQHKANPDLYIKDASGIVVLLHEDKSHDNTTDNPFAQVSPFSNDSNLSDSGRSGCLIPNRTNPTKEKQRIPFREEFSSRYLSWDHFHLPSCNIS